MTGEETGVVQDDEIVIALTPVQLVAVLAGLVVLFVVIRARRAR